MVPRRVLDFFWWLAERCHEIVVSSLCSLELDAAEAQLQHYRLQCTLSLFRLGTFHGNLFLLALVAPISLVHEIPKRRCTSFEAPVLAPGVCSDVSLTWPNDSARPTNLPGPQRETRIGALEEYRLAVWTSGPKKIG